MTKQKKSINFIQLITVIFFTLIVVYLLLAIKRSQYPGQKNRYQPTLQSTISNSNSYQFPLLEFEIQLPPNFSIAREGPQGILISSSEGKILISKAAINFKSIQEYFEWLAPLNNIRYENRQNLNINGLNAIRVDILGQLTENFRDRGYFIYIPNYGMYTISTESSELFDELDQVAKSFKYTGKLDE